MDMAPSGACAAGATGTVAMGAETLQVGQAKYFPDAGAPYLSFVVARDAKGFFALRTRCTHQQCQVAVNAAAQSYDCPCHGSRFNLDGTVLKGPATMPLEVYPLCKTSDGKLLVDNSGNGTANRTDRVT
jgi:Rieske Fe-S protein